MSITLNGDTGILVPANAEIEVGTNNGLSSPAANKIAINTNGTQRLIVDDSGNIGVGTGNPAMALDVSGQMRASSGILFGTDTAAVNTLDDYETGTWEPDIRPVTGSFASVTYSTETGGTYIKIGKVVYLTACVRWTALNISGGSSTALIGNLPFSCAPRTNGDDADGAGSANTHVWGGAALRHPTNVRMKRSDSNLYLTTQNVDEPVIFLGVDDLGSTGMITFTIVMHTS